MANTQASKNYHPLLTVQDKRLNTATLAQYYLSICISDTSFKVSCIDPKTTKCLLLEVYSLAHECGHRRVQAIEQLYQDHRLLAKGNWSAVTLCVGNQNYSLIPEQFFQENKLADYLNFTCPIAPNVIKHFTHSSLNLAVAFAVDPLLMHWLQKTYKQTKLQIVHQASSLIEGTLNYLRSSRLNLLPKVLVFTEANHLHIIIIQKSDLLYYNRFEYTNSDEFLRYILTVMHTLKLDPNFHEVILGGHISKGSIAHRKARNYLRKLTFITPPPYLKFRNIFNKGVWTTHLDVLSTCLCYQTL